jgi:hypothetical protein
MNKYNWNSFLYFSLKSRDLLVAALSISELPEGSADPVELSARIEDGKKKEKYVYYKKKLSVFLKLFIKNSIIQVLNIAIVFVVVLPI